MKGLKILSISSLVCFVLTVVAYNLDLHNNNKSRLEEPENQIINHK